MSKHKIVIDLERLSLSPEQIKALHTALHKTVVTQLKKGTAAPAKPATKTAKKAPKKLGLTGGAAAAPATKTATVTATFFNVPTGKSELRAILNGQTKTINKSGRIPFNNVTSGDAILIQGTSLGTTTVTIDVSAEPAQMSFPPGNFNDQFLIN